MKFTDKVKKIINDPRLYSSDPLGGFVLNANKAATAVQQAAIDTIIGNGDIVTNYTKPEQAAAFEAGVRFAIERFDG